MWPLQKIKNAAATVGAQVKNLSNNMMVVEESPKIQNLIDLDEPVTQEMTISELVNKFQTTDLPLILKQFDAWQQYEINCNQLKASLKSIDQESQKQFPTNFELQTFYRKDQFNDRLNRLTNDILELSKIKYAPLVKENRQLKQKLQAQPATQEMQKAIDSLREEKEYFKNEQIKLSLEYNALEQSLTSKISDLSMKNQVQEMEKNELNKQIDEYIQTINNAQSPNILDDKLRQCVQYFLPQLKRQVQSLKSELLTLKTQPVQFNFDYTIPEFTNNQIQNNIHNNNNKDKLLSLIKMVGDYKKQCVSADLQTQLQNDSQFIQNLFIQLEQYSIKQIEQFNHQYTQQQNQILLLQEQISCEIKEKEKLQIKLNHKNQSLKSILQQILELKSNQSDIIAKIKQFNLIELTEIEQQMNSQEDQLICIKNLNEKYVNQLNGANMLLEDTQHQLEKCYNQIYEKDQLLSIQYNTLQEFQYKLEQEQYDQYQQQEVQDQQQLIQIQEQVEQVQQVEQGQEIPEQQNEEIPKQQSYIERLNMQLQDIYEHDEMQQQQIASLMQENAQLQQNQLNYEQEDKLVIEKLKEKITEFISLNQQLQNQILEKEKEITISTQFIESLEEQLSLIKSNYSEQLSSLTEYVKDKIKLSQDGQNVEDELSRKQEILELQSQLKQQLLKQNSEETELKEKIIALEQSLRTQEQEFNKQQNDLIQQKDITIQNCLKENAEQAILNQRLHEKNVYEYEQQINNKEDTIQKLINEHSELIQQKDLIVNHLQIECAQLKQQQVDLQRIVDELQLSLEQKDQIITDNDLQFKIVESELKEQMTSLRQDLSAQLSSEEQKVHQLEEINLQYQNEIEKLNEQLKQLNLSHEAQLQEAINFENIMASLSQELEQLKIQLSDKEQELQNLNLSQEDIKQSLESKLKEQLEINQQHNELQSQWEIEQHNLKEQLRAQEGQIKQNEEIFANKQEQYSQLQSENNELLIQIDEINQQLANRNTESTQQLQEQTQKIEQLEVEIKSLKEQISLQLNQVQTLNLQIEQQQNELSMKQQQIEKEELENQNISNMIVELESNTQKAEFEKQQAQTERDDLKQNMNHLEQKIMTLNEQMLQLNEDNDSLVNQLKKQKVELQKLNDLKQGYELLTVEIGLCLTIEIKEQFDKNKQQIIASIQQLKEQLRKEEDKVKLIAIKNTELQTQLSEIQNKVINEYQKKELSSQQELQQVQQKLNENIEKQNYLQQQMQKLEQKRKELEQKIVDFEKNKKEQDQDIVNKRNEIENQKQQLKNKQNELQQLGQQFQTQANEISKLQEQCNQVIQKNQEIQKLQKKCQSYEETILQLNGGVQNLQMVNEIQQQKCDLMQKEYEEQIKQLKAIVVEVPVIEDNLQERQELQQKIRKKEEQIVILINEKEQLNESYVKKIEEINLGQQNLVDKRIIKDFLINYFDNRTPHKVRLSLLETICCILTMNDREREKIGLHIQRLNQALLQQKSNDKTLKDNFIDYLLNG